MPKRILLADDSVTIQKVVELTFAEGDYEVTSVSNGRAAIEKVKESRPDILLCDIIMPEVSGYEVAEFVKKNPTFSAIPVILLTGTFEPFDEEKARQSGADTYITKPFDSRMLVEKVESLLRSRLVLDAAEVQGPVEVLTGQGRSMTVGDQAPASPFPTSAEAVFGAADFGAPEEAPAPPPPPPPETPAFAAAPEVSLPPVEAPAFGAAVSPFAAAASPFEAAASPFEEAAPAPPEPAAFAPAEPPAPSLFAAAPEPPPPALPPAPAVVDVAAFQPAVMDVADFQPAAEVESAFEAAAAPPAPEAPSPFAAAPEPALPEAAAPEAAFSVESEEPVAEPAAAVSEVAPPLPPFAGSEAAEPEVESYAGTFETPKLPAFVESEEAQPEVESSPWGDTGAEPEAVESVDGLIHDMNDQTEMVAEAHPFDPTTATVYTPRIEDEPVLGAPPVPAEPEPEVAEEPFAPVAPEAAPAVVAEVAATPEPPAAPQFSQEQLEEVVRRVVAEMAPELVRQVAWEVIPELAESIIKRRIQELEAQVE